MKKYIIALFFIFLAASLPASEALISYMEGDVSVKGPYEDYTYPEIGDMVMTGETIITEYDGYVELEREENLIRISPDTIFTYSESEVDGTKRDAFTCVVGEVAFKIDKITGVAPEFNTLCAAAGVRGTEFTLYAGVDGSSLVVVTEGVVEVSADGEAVSLFEGEGVEVETGSAPGEKFKVLRGQLSYKEWNLKKLEAFLKEPVAAVYKIQSRMESFIGEIERLKELYDVNKLVLEDRRKKLDELTEREERNAYYSEEVFPLEVETSYMMMNIRYWSLSALSLRRYVAGKLYVLMKAKYMANLNDSVFRDFLYAHGFTVKMYEDSIVPYLVDADI